MSEHSLPDDLQKWPRDPYRLLGIDSLADERETRRAYVRLIRQFKPDHQPDHFQRIRAAYETVQEHLASRFRESDSWEFEDADSSPAPSPASESSPHDSSPRPSSVDVLAAAWQTARTGDLTGGYARLVESWNQSRDRSDACLRLYWLLTADPLLDASRQPRDWLVAALQNTRLSGPALELYRREIADDREALLSDQDSQLIDIPVTPDRLLELLDARWRGLSFLQRWDVLLQDLNRLQERDFHDHQAGWARIQLFALDQLAWFTQHPDVQDAFERCRRDVEHWNHLHAELEDGLDRMDLLVDLVAGWRALQSTPDIPGAWLDLVPLAWTQNFDVVRPHLLPVLKEIGEKPAAALAMFDRIAMASPSVASHLGSLIHHSRYYHDAHDFEDPETDELVSAAAAFLGLFGADYTAARRDFLDFCLQRGMDPEWLCNAIDQILAVQISPDTSWSDAIRGDGPVRYVYAGWRSFWG